MSRRLVKKISHLGERYSSRRRFLRSLVMSATAIAFAPAYIVRPISAEAAIITCLGLQCTAGSHCCDGWTEFCCRITGENTCPPGTVVAGWWKVDNSDFCSYEKEKPRPRYYLDCNVVCGHPALCQCPEGCDTKRVDCVSFRYGQCNQDTCVGPIRCRVVTCVPPWRWDPACHPAPVLTEERTRHHDRSCLHDGFTDIPPYAFYADAVKWVSDRGIITGLTDDLFGPDESVRWAEFATFLWRYAGKPTRALSSEISRNFSDSYFERAVAWMVEEQIIINGLPSDFDSTRQVSRAEVITYLHRMAGSPPALPHKELFPDIVDGAWYADELDWAVSYGIVWWSLPLSFDPNRSINRAEAAVFLHRFGLSDLPPSGNPKPDQGV